MTTGPDVAAMGVVLLLFAAVARYCATRAWFWRAIGDRPTDVERMIRINRYFWAGVFIIGLVVALVGLAMWATGSTIG